MNQKNKISAQGENIIFLMSMPRSGSTLLSMMFSSHSEIACPPEPWLLLFAAEWLNLSSVRSAPYGRNNAQIAALEYLQGLENKKSGTIEKIFKRLSHRKKSDYNSDTIAREFVQSAYNAHLGQHEKKIFIDKTPRNYTILSLIDKLFPLSKKIYLKRNPLDIAYSYSTTWKISIKEIVGEKLSVNSRDFSEGLYILRDYFLKPSPLKYVVAYEDLVSESKTQLSNLCSFIGVDFKPGMLKYYKNKAVINNFSASAMGDPESKNNPKSINSESIGRGINHFNRTDMQALLSAFGRKVFSDLGYDDVLIQLDKMNIEIPDEQTSLSCRRKNQKNIRSKQFIKKERNNLLGKQIETLKKNIDESEADRSARWEQIETLTEMLEKTKKQLHEAELDRTARWEQIETLTAMLEDTRLQLQESEADRAARLIQIETLTKMLKKC